MVRPYSMDLRERLVLAAIDDGMSCRSAAVRFGVAPSTTIRWVLPGFQCRFAPALSPPSQAL